ncbi:MAG: patatin-like phospholipase family protein [Bacteroidota bacterium]
MKKIILALLLIGSLTFSQEKHRPKVGLVLSGGGALGFAHIGALKVLDSIGIPIDYIAGTSFGGLMGGLYSIGYRTDSLLKIVNEVNWDEIFNDVPERSILPYFEKKYSGRYYVSLPIKDFTPTPPGGAIAGQKISLLFSRLTDRYAGVTDLDSLPIPFRCVGVDLVTGNEVVISKGPLARAMRATMSIPTAFTPVPYGDSLLSDGGLLNNYPVDVLKSMGADIVIGVDVSGFKFSPSDAAELFKVLDRASSIPRYQKINQEIALTDIYIAPQLDGYSIADFDKETIARIMDSGYVAAERQRENLAALRDRILSYGGESARPPVIRTIPSEYTIHGIQIVGNDHMDFTFLYTLLGLKSGQKCSSEILEQHINELYSLGYFRTVTYAVEPVTDTTADVIITVKEKLFQELNIGMRYDEFYQLVGLVGVRATNILYTGLRFESEFEFAGLIRSWARISYPARSLDMPVYPYLSFRLRKLPLYVYDNTLVYQFNDRSVSGSAGIGFSIAKSWLIETEYVMDMMSVSARTLVGFPDQQYRLRYMFTNINLDYLDDVLVPRSGAVISNQWELSRKELGSEYNYSRNWFRFDSYLSPSEHNTIMLGASYLSVNGNRPFFKNFFFGGPRQFIGADYMQINGSELLVGRGEYRYEFRTNFFVKGYLNVFSDPKLYKVLDGTATPPKYGAGIGLMINSMIGPVELIVARGESSYQSTASSPPQYLFHIIAGMKF